VHHEEPLLGDRRDIASTLLRDKSDKPILDFRRFPRSRLSNFRFDCTAKPINTHHQRS